MKVLSRAAFAMPGIRIVLPPTRAQDLIGRATRPCFIRQRVLAAVEPALRAHALTPPADRVAHLPPPSAVKGLIDDAIEWSASVQISGQLYGDTEFNIFTHGARAWRHWWECGTRPRCPRMQMSLSAADLIAVALCLVIAQSLDTIRAVVSRRSQGSCATRC